MTVEKINAAALVTGTEILVTTDINKASKSAPIGDLMIARVKQGVQVAIVISVKAVAVRGNRCTKRAYTVVTNLGTLEMLAPIQTMWHHSS